MMAHPTALCYKSPHASNKTHQLRSTGASSANLHYPPRLFRAWFCDLRGGTDPLTLALSTAIPQAVRLPEDCFP